MWNWEHAKAFREDKPEDVTLPPIFHGLVLPLQWKRKAGREKVPCVAQEKSPTRATQRTRLNLQHYARRLSLLILSVCSVPVLQLVSSDQAHSMCYIFLCHYFFYFLEAKFNLWCLIGAECMRVFRLTQFEPEHTVATLTPLRHKWPITTTSLGLAVNHEIKARINSVCKPFIFRT